MDANTENDSYIITCSQQFWPDFSISQHQLDHPTAEFVIEFYQNFRDTMKSLINQMAAITDTSEQEQVKAESDNVFPLLRFLNQYFKIFHLTGQPDCTVTLYDLYSPTAKRTKIRFKVLLNTLMFYEDRVEQVNSVVVKRLKQADEFKAKKKDKEQWKESLGKVAEDVARNEDEIAKLQKELSKAETNYSRLQEKTADIDRDCKKLQHELKVLVDTFKNKQTLLTNIKTSIEHLNEEVVNEESYKSLQDLKENLVKKCKELDVAAGYITTNLESKKPTVEHFYNIIKLIQVSNFEDLKTAENAIVENNNQLKLHELTSQEKNKQLQKLNKDKLKYREDVKAKNEAIQSGALKDNKLLEEITQELKEIELEKKEEESLQSNLHDSKNALQQIILNSEKNCAQVVKDIEKLNVFCANTYTEILNDENSVTIYFNEVMGNIAECFSAPVDN